MDAETREALARLDERITTTTAETRKELRGEMRSMAAELRGEMQALGSELRGEMRALAVDLRAEVRAGDEETRRHMGVLVEGLRAEFRVVSEALEPLTRRIAGVDADHDRRLDALEIRVTALESRCRRRRR